MDTHKFLDWEKKGSFSAVLEGVWAGRKRTERNKWKKTERQKEDTHFFMK